VHWSQPPAAQAWKSWPSRKKTNAPLEFTSHAVAFTDTVPAGVKTSHSSIAKPVAKQTEIF
jgi:hypothetical protein